MPKLINKVETCLENKGYSELGDDDNLLANIFTAPPQNILPHCSGKHSENLPEKYLIEISNLSQKDLFTQIRTRSSLPKTVISSHQSERSIFCEKRV